MIFDSQNIEERVALTTAERMIAAARTAPKTKGKDHIRACVATAGDKDALAREMERLSETLGYGFFMRDAQNVRAAQAVVLIGTTEERMALGAGCGYCHFGDCAGCEKQGGVCVYNMIDLGIALGSAASQAADARVDSRVMFSVGRAAFECRLLGDDVTAVMGIVLSVSGKSPFFDRKA